MSTVTEFTADDRRIPTLLGVICPAALWLGLLGPAWAYVPANAPANAPAMDLTFAGLAAASVGSPSFLQTMYFSWLGWVFAAASTVLAIATVRTGTRVLSGICVLAGVFQAVVTVLAMKGPLSWSVLMSGIGNTRLGVALVFVGYIALIVIGVLGLGAAASARESKARVMARM